MPDAFVQIRPGEVVIVAPQQFYAGDDWEIPAQCNDAEGNPLNLEDATVTWVLNEAEDEAVNRVVRSIGDGVVLEQNTSGDLIMGMCLIRVPRATTAMLEPGYYLHELTVLTATNSASTQFRGRIDVLSKLTGPISGG